MAYKYLRTNRIAFTRPFGSCRKLLSVRAVTSPDLVEEEVQDPGTEEAGEADHVRGSALHLYLIF